MRLICCEAFPLCRCVVQWYFSTNLPPLKPTWFLLCCCFNKYAYVCSINDKLVGHLKYVEWCPWRALFPSNCVRDPAPSHALCLKCAQEAHVCIKNCAWHRTTQYRRWLWWRVQAVSLPYQPRAQVCCGMSCTVYAVAFPGEVRGRNVCVLGLRSFLSFSIWPPGICLLRERTLSSSHT